MGIAKASLGLVAFIFCLAISLLVPDLFSYSTDIEEMIQYGFIALGIFSIIGGILLPD